MWWVEQTCTWEVPSTGEHTPTHKTTLRRVNTYHRQHGAVANRSPSNGGVCARANKNRDKKE